MNVYYKITTRHCVGNGGLSWDVQSFRSDCGELKKKKTRNDKTSTWCSTRNDAKKKSAISLSFQIIISQIDSL
jgi:hypothetical protein